MNTPIENTIFFMDFKNKKKMKGMERSIEKEGLKEIIEQIDPKIIDKEYMTNILRNIKDMRKIDKKEIAKLIIFMADFPERSWNLKDIMEALKTNLSEVNWRDVYSCFLEEDFNIWSLDSLYLIIDCWIYISGIITVPYELFFKKWKNSRAQIYFLRLIIESDEKRTQLYSNVFFKKIVKLEETRNSRFKNVLNYESNFNCVELFECIKSLDSMVLIEQIAKKSLEWCIAGLSYIQPSFEKIFDEILISFMRSSSNNFIFYVLFRDNPKTVLNRVPKCLSHGISLSKILDVVLEQKMLPYISDNLDPPGPCLDILVLSSKRDHLNLNIWLTNNISSKRDAFVKVLIEYMEQKIKILTSSQSKSSESSNDKSPDIAFDTSDKRQSFFDKNLKSENIMIDKLFPLTVESMLIFVKAIEQYQKHLTFETVTYFNFFKKQIPQVIKIKKGIENNIDEQASTFISSVVNSQMTTKEGVDQIIDMQKGDVTSKELTYKIFSTLVDNYTALFKLPNSDILAKFYGELIKNKIIPKPYLKVALSYIKKSLVYPESEREFFFAFKCLEVFITSMPKFLAEVEEIENVRSNLLKKDLILVDENFYSKLSHHEFFKQAFKIDNPANNTKIADLYTTLKRGVVSKTSNFADVLKDKQQERVELVQYLIKILYIEDIYMVFLIVNGFDYSFKQHFIVECLNVMKVLLNFQIDNELDFSKNLGLILGKLTLSQNKIVTLEKFDFKNFLVSSIECRRILLGVTFICHFIKQGKEGIVFIPNNPWLVSILNLLAELHTCTLKQVRKEIEGTFSHFNLQLEPKIIKSFKFKTKDYLSEYILSGDDPILKHVISLALDFSVREISEIIIEKSCEIAIKTGIVLFKTIVVEKGNEYVVFRNLLINLTKSLCYMSAQEPMRACMSGNISYFLKLSALELAPDEIYNIVSDNQNLCCQLIQRAGVSKVGDCISDYFKNIEMSTGKYSEINLDLLENTTHIEKFSIKTIEPSEYQDLKSHFLQISRRRATDNNDFVSEEWHYLLGSNAKEEFIRIKTHIMNSDDVDAECIKLCKYITGHLIKTNTTNDFLFKCLKEIFKISFKTQKEVLGWLIYSNDPRRFSINFVSKFIEHRLVNIVEYDQALSRNISPETNLDFVLSLLSNLMTSDIQICTVYDFIATLEALANYSDEGKVYDFFQKISKLMMVFDNSDTTEFDDLIKSERYNIFTEDVMHNRVIRYNINNFNIKGAFKSSWEHFIRHHKVPTQYCYYKIDMVPLLIKSRANLYIKDTLDILLDAYKRRNYLFVKFYTRFVKKLLDVIDDTVENKYMVRELLTILSPSNIPFFTTGYLDIIRHNFILQSNDIERIFNISLEAIDVLKHSEEYIYPVTKYFELIKDNKPFIKAYGIYLSYLCPYKYAHLKNIFNQYRDNIQFLEDQNEYFKIRRMLQSNMQSIKEYYSKPYFIFYLLDNLNEKNIVSMYTFNNIRTLLNEKKDIKRIIALLWVYSIADNTPNALNLYFEELKSYEWVNKIIESFESKFNK